MQLRRELWEDVGSYLPFLDRESLAATCTTFHLYFDDRLCAQREYLSVHYKTVIFGQHPSIADESNTIGNALQQVICRELPPAMMKERPSDTTHPRLGV